MTQDFDSPWKEALDVYFEQFLALLQFVDEVDKFQKENKMPFITSPERVWHDRGMRKGIATALRLRFGPEGMALMPDVENLYEEQLDAVLETVEKATTLDEVRQVCRTMMT